MSPRPETDRLFKLVEEAVFKGRDLPPPPPLSTPTGDISKEGPTEQSVIFALEMLHAINMTYIYARWCYLLPASTESRAHLAGAVRKYHERFRENLLLVEEIYGKEIKKRPEHAKYFSILKNEWLSEMDADAEKEAGGI